MAPSLDWVGKVIFLHLIVNSSKVGMGSGEPKISRSWGESIFFFSPSKIFLFGDSFANSNIVSKPDIETVTES